MDPLVTFMESTIMLVVPGLGNIYREVSSVEG
jgi:hypothetical protein